MAGGRAAHRHRQLLLVGELLIVVRKVVTLCRRCLATVCPAHAVLVDRRVDELAVVQADLVRRERAGRKARLPAREPAHAASALPPRAYTALGLQRGLRRGLRSAGRSAPVELLDDGAGLPATTVALHARAHLEPQRGGGDVSLLDVHTCGLERSAQRAVHVGPAGVGVGRLQGVGTAPAATRLALPRRGSQGRGEVLRLGLPQHSLASRRTPCAQGVLRWASACGCLAAPRRVSCLVPRRAPPQRARKWLLEVGHITYL